MDKRSSPLRPVTVADVARRAGVSKATAARALGDYGVVSEEARRCVFAAAKALDYRPNELARSMTTGKSGTIGVVVGDIENAFFGRAVRSISDTAHRHGFNVILANSGERIETEKAALKVLIGKRVDGLIVAPADNRDVSHLRDIVRSRRPLALFDRAIDGLAVDTVVTDDRQAAFSATTRLIAAGHCRLAYVTAADADSPRLADAGQLYISSVQARVEGFFEACRTAGIAEADREVHLVGQREAGYQNTLIERILEASTAPTAILASDSLIAFEIVKATQRLHRRIPDDLSLISFFDADWTSVTSPPISVIDQPVHEMGTRVAELLIARINGETATPSLHQLANRYVERASVGAARMMLMTR